MPRHHHSDALQHMNDDHAAGLLALAQAFAGHPDATAASAEAVDQRGVDLRVETPAGLTDVRVEFAEPIPEDDYPDGLRVAFVRLVRSARAELAARGSMDP